MKEKPYTEQESVLLQYLKTGEASPSEKRDFFNEPLEED